VGTSAPEFAVSLTAALDEGSSMAISNVLGSNIFNLGFILGGVAIFRPVATGSRVVWRDGTVLLISSLAVWLLFGIDLGVDRSNGALLLLGLVCYLTLLIATARAERPADSDEGGLARPRGAVWLQLLGGIILIAASAELLVEAASSIASTLGLSEWVIGITIVAAGTSLPEFTTSMVAVARGHYGLSLGNIIGSDIFNVLGVLGLTALLQPVPIGPEASTLVFMRTGWRLSRAEGAVLIVFGILRWAFDFMA
jgi:cation:H+ antiporter